MTYIFALPIDYTDFQRVTSSADYMDQPLFFVGHSHPPIL